MLPEDVSVSGDTVQVAVLRETIVGETRVALVPDDVVKLIEAGVTVSIQVGAGSSAFFGDDLYAAAGANLIEDPRQLLSTADILPVVRPPADPLLLGALRENAVVVGFLDPSRSQDLINSLAVHRVTTFAMEFIPRITRAQVMDALSSMSTIAGYRAVLLAAAASNRMFPMLITAAGTQPPCRVLVLGAGVAGLQALATAKRLGGLTFGFDTRPEVREQVQSVGATFVQMEQELEVEGTEGGYAKEVGKDFLQREQDAIAPHVETADAVITTALIPGRPAPLLITRDMVRRMKPGAVIVDLAAEQGGNCEVTEFGTTVVWEGVTVVSPANVPAQAATQASQMYSRNISNFIRLLVRDGAVNVALDDDEILRGACLTYAGEVVK